MGTVLKKYTVKAGDRVQDIAARELGDVSRWLDIVALNRLRRPYISDNLLDQFGPLQGTLPLQGNITAGDTKITDWDITVSPAAGNRAFNSQSILVPGAILVFIYQGTDSLSMGDPQFDVVQITTVDQGQLYGSGHISLSFDVLGIETYRSLNKSLVTKTGGFSRSHTAGDLFYVYGSPLQLTHSVARTGDTLSLPVAINLPGYEVSSTKDLVDSLGVDVLLDSTTGQKQVGAGGDFSLVSGVSNVEQALRVRAKTEPGELILHPEYGNSLKLYIGYIQNSGWPNLAMALLRDCLLEDPRVEDVVGMNFRSQGDVNFIDCLVKINESGQVFSTTVRVS